jgi:hypothetical protein
MLGKNLLKKYLNKRVNNDNVVKSIIFTTGTRRSRRRIRIYTIFSFGLFVLFVFYKNLGMMATFSRPSVLALSNFTMLQNKNWKNLPKTV